LIYEKEEDKDKTVMEILSFNSLQETQEPSIKVEQIDSLLQRENEVLTNLRAHIASYNLELFDLEEKLNEIRKERQNAFVQIRKGYQEYKDLLSKIYKKSQYKDFIFSLKEDAEKYINSDIIDLSIQDLKDPTKSVLINQLRELHLLKKNTNEKELEILRSHIAESYPEISDQYQKIHFSKEKLKNVLIEERRISEKKEEILENISSTMKIEEEYLNKKSALFDIFLNNSDIISDEKPSKKEVNIIINKNDYTLNNTIYNKNYKAIYDVITYLNSRISSSIHKENIEIYSHALSNFYIKLKNISSYFGDPVLVKFISDTKIINTSRYSNIQMQNELERVKPEVLQYILIEELEKWKLSSPVNMTLAFYISKFFTDVILSLSTIRKYHEKDWSVVKKIRALSNISQYTKEESYFKAVKFVNVVDSNNEEISILMSQFRQQLECNAKHELLLDLLKNYLNLEHTKNEIVKEI
jgi:hypothetical protein